MGEELCSTVPAEEMGLFWTRNAAPTPGGKLPARAVLAVSSLTHAKIRAKTAAPGCKLHAPAGMVRERCAIILRHEKWQATHRAKRRIWASYRTAQPGTAVAQTCHQETRLACIQMSVRSISRNWWRASPISFPFLQSIENLVRPFTAAKKRIGSSDI